MNFIQKSHLRRLLHWTIPLYAMASMAASSTGCAERSSAEPEPSNAEIRNVRTYQNPVLAFDCPDPSVIAARGRSGTKYQLVCTGGSFPIRSSRDLVTWKDAGASIFPSGKSPWAGDGERNWAPEIHSVGDQFIAYYTASNAQGSLAVGAARANTVLGTYTDVGHPLVEDPDGVIDATYFQDDDGSRWLVYKTDGNGAGRPAHIFARRLAPDGLSVAGEPVHILTNDPETWEHGVVEAPWLVKRAGQYFLFYSGGVYTVDYRVGIARAASVTGPYEKHGTPILSDNERWVLPGHGTVVPIGQDDYFVYHAWVNAGDGTPARASGRQVLLDRIVWENGWPRIHEGSPSHTPQPIPQQP